MSHENNNFLRGGFSLLLVELPLRKQKLLERAANSFEGGGDAIKTVLERACMKILPRNARRG